MFSLTAGLFLCLAVSVGVSALEYGDPCWITNVGQDAVINIPNSCKVGQIDWHYPRDSVLVRLSLPNTSFSLCLEEGWSTNIQGVVEVTAGVENAQPLPREGHPTCIKSVHNEAVFRVVASDTLYYMTSFNFRVTE
ncbi:uncharacterized protein LOC131934674 [Physella acuta]|uniref:uncharacterized protein LOC131934674 n=1 Tax=Physella acuta TaxID=109671 RepID=UPI0027DCFDA6|nr:uncharacterized protein LOC131934674 [Physella acuta]